MGSLSFSARYAAAMAEGGGRCPIEAGVLGRLADHECGHGRLAFDRTPPCGCWGEEGAVVLALARPLEEHVASHRAQAHRRTADRDQHLAPHRISGLYPG